MKMLKTVAIAASVAAAAGCARDQQASYSDRYTYSAYTPVNTGSGSSSSTQSSSSRSSGTVNSSTTSSGSSGFAEDIALIGQVRQSLNQDATLTSIVPALQISARNGIVTLGGTVNSEDQKRNIESIVQQIAGVTTVNNQLQVSSLSATSRTNETSGTYSGTANSGSEMQGAGGGLAQTAVATDVLTPTSRTNEQQQMYWTTNQTESATNDTLSATSDRMDQSGTRRMFETNQAAGGNETVNKPTANIQSLSAADKTLAQQISQELSADSALASLVPQVRMSVNDGKVTLQGTVRNEQQKQDIEAAIQRISGVSSVDNQLQVGSDQPLPR